MKESHWFAAMHQFPFSFTVADPSAVGRLVRYLFLGVCLLLVGCCEPAAGPPTAQPIVREFTVPAGEVTLHARMAGGQQADHILIAIHGGPGMTSDYLLNLEQLAGPDLAVVTYDQRGVGRSSSPPAIPENYTLVRYAEDLEAVRQAIDTERVHLFGHSWGGIVAQRYATLYPERVRSISFMGSGPPTREQTEQCQNALIQRAVELQQQGVIAKNLEPGSREAERGLLAAYFSDPTFWFTAEDGAAAPLIDQRADLVGRLTWEANTGFDLTADLARLNHRVLNMWGDDDPVRPIASPAIVAALPNAAAETVVFRNCGHFWHECPNQFYPSLQAFLGLDAAE